MKNKKIIVVIILLAICCGCAALFIGGKFNWRTQKTQTDAIEVVNVTESENLAVQEALSIYTNAYTVWCDWMNSGYLKYGARDENKRINDEYITEDGKSYDGVFQAIEHESINSIAELKKILGEYFVEDIYNTLVDRYYREKDGVLYGFVDFYGETWCSPVNEITATLLKDGIDIVKYEFTHPCYYPGDVKAYESVKYPINFVKDNGKWKISDGDWRYDVILYEFPN